MGSAECYIGGIFNNNQPVGGTVVAVTIDLSDDHLGFDPGPNGNVPVLKRGTPAPRRGLQKPGMRSQHQAMLDGKVEKLQAMVAQQQKQNAQQQKQIETLTAQLKEQTETFTAQLKEQATQIQKVSAQLELNKAAPQTVKNND